MMTLRERYYNDPKFNALVKVMESQIFHGEFTPSEVREAAMLASILYEEQNIHEMVYIEEDIEISLRKIRKYVDREVTP